LKNLRREGITNKVVKSDVDISKIFQNARQPVIRKR